MSRESIFGGVVMAVLALAGAVAPAAAGTSYPAPLAETQYTATTPVKPLVGDFNGDLVDDVFWYGPGTQPDLLWLTEPHDALAPPVDDGTFEEVAVSVNGEYKPLVGDFDGNGVDDIFWYGVGNDPDSIWYFGVGGAVAAVPQNVSGFYNPVVGNFDTGSTTDPVEIDDIFWYPTRPGNASLWAGQAGGGFAKTTYTTVPPARAQVLVGDFQSNASVEPADDLFFYGPGRRADAQWTSNGDGTFTVRNRVVKGIYRPVVAQFPTTGSELAPLAVATTVPSLEPLAANCWAGDASACDELAAVADPGLFVTHQPYFTYAVTCAGRRPAASDSCLGMGRLGSRSQILWYGPGRRAGDRLWTFAANGNITAKELRLDFSATPRVLEGDRPGTEGGDVVIWRIGSGTERVSGHHPHDGITTSFLGEMGVRRPLVGEFHRHLNEWDNVGVYDDILWWAPGGDPGQEELLQH